MHAELVWKFETKHFAIEAYFMPDGGADTSWDETGETRDNLASGLWTAFGTEVVVYHKATGVKLASDSLWGSIYEKPCDFLTEHYGCRPKGYRAYFPDMVREAVREARKQHNALSKPSLRAA